MFLYPTCREGVGGASSGSAMVVAVGDGVTVDNGNPILKDMCSDFAQAIRSLRNTVGFVEGSSLENVEKTNSLYGSEKMLLKNGPIFTKLQAKLLKTFTMELFILFKWKTI